MIDESTASAVAEYNPIAAGLAECRQRYAGVVYDLRTTNGNDDARKARKELVTLRTSLESKRKELKAPLLAQAKLVDDEAKRITGELLALEEPIDAQIKADEARREAEKQASEEAERKRVAAIRERIAAIVAQPAKAARLRSSALLATAIDALHEQELAEDDFAEFLGEARAAQDAALASMGEMLATLREHEAEAARLKAEREALERAEREAAERRAEEERVAREQREAEVARLREERARQEAEIRAAREAEEAAAAERRRREDEERAARQAELDAEAARLAAEREAFERAQREQAAREAEAQAEKEAAERAEREAREAAERAEREAREAAERDARQREAERMGRLQAAAPRMFDALRMVRASAGFTGLGRAAQEAVVDALDAATEPKSEPEQAAA